MELRHLEYFVAVAEEQSFTRAAARLHVVQSAVSAGIQALEQELRVKVLHRTSREVRLTDAGEIFLPNAREALASAQRAIDAVDEIRGGLRGILRIGTMTSTGAIDLPAILGRFHRENPQVTVRVSTRPGGSRELAQAVELGALDVALLSLGRPMPQGLVVNELHSAAMGVLVPDGHRLAGRGGVRLRELAHESFVDFPAGYGSRLVVDNAFKDIGVTRQVSLEVSDSGTAAHYVRHGLGIAILSDTLAPEREGLTRLDVTDADLRWRVFIAHSRTRQLSAAARALEVMLTPPRD